MVASLYERMGGASRVQMLVDVFYDIVETEPEGEILHRLHLRGHGVAHSRIEQFNFLSGFLGGPKLYVEKYGHSDVREMHRHVEIGTAEKDAWLLCMSKAIDRVGIAPDIAATLMKHFRAVANALENQNSTLTQMC